MADYTNKKGFGFKEAKEQIDLKDYLALLDFQPAKHSPTNEFWYHSSIRTETQRPLSRLTWLMVSRFDLITPKVWVETWLILE